jgi:TonB family protein
MSALRYILALFLLLTIVSLSASSQGPIAPRPSPSTSVREYPNSPEGLRWQLQDILNAARDHNRSRLESLVKQTEIPNYKEWFTGTFGREKGDIWAEAYERYLGQGEKDLEVGMIQLAGEDGEFETRKVNDDPAPARKMEVAMVVALQRPVDILFASWKKREAPRDSKSSPIGYFFYLEGRFRLNSAFSSAEIQLDPGADNAASRENLPAQTAVSPNNPPVSGKGNGVSPPGVGGVGYPSCDDCPQPEYTQLARAKHLEGTVVLQVTIQADGSITDIDVVKTPGAELTQMAIDGVSKWHMNPARLADGEPVPVRVPIEVTFRLVKQK